MPSRRFANLRLHGALNDFLPGTMRRGRIEIPVDGTRSVKDAIESVGVPHVEIDVIIVDGRSVDFAYLLRGGEDLDAYTSCLETSGRDILGLRPATDADARFVVDGHLAKLARNLRMAGFDVLWQNDWHDDHIVALAHDGGRTILTRDKAMLRRGDVERGYFVRATDAEGQFAEVLDALRLVPLVNAFTRCRECNALLEDVPPESVQHRLPGNVRGLYDRFRHCPGCDRVYWEGTHFQRMKAAMSRAGGEYSTQTLPTIPLAVRSPQEQD